MSIDLRPRNGSEGRSRILLSAENAAAFRKLCRLTKKDPDVLLEELIRVYVKAEKLKIAIVER